MDKSLQAAWAMDMYGWPTLGARKIEAGLYSNRREAVNRVREDGKSQLQMRSIRQRSAAHGARDKKKSAGYSGLR